MPPAPARTRAALLAALGAAVLQASPLPEPEPDPDPLAARGIRVTVGAAPGYLPDHACALCHAEIAASYREVAMSRAFHPPRPEDDTEVLGAVFVHEPSARRYEMRREDGRLLFRRWQLDDAGTPINLLEQEVHFVLGSGNHARTYLYRTPGGELYQLPIAWYSQTKAWGMAPGFDRPDHDGVRRMVRRECLFCHNAYPDVPAGSDARLAPHAFPERLPEGIGCQRCHGPGADHARAAFRGEVAAARAAVVNPARLPAPLRDDVCDACHLQPSVAIPGARRFGRGDYSFRPGEPLADYLVQTDVVEAGRSPAERFEINHHPYRLRQSRCFTGSGGRLGCLTCHDPHRKVAAPARAGHYRAACLTCHDAGACRRPASSGDAADHGDDCVSCHMAARRPQDVVRVVMTDHLIRRRPGGPELIGPLEEEDPTIVDVTLLDRERGPAGPRGELYRALTVLRTAASEAALDRTESLLASRPVEDPTPYLDLAQAQLAAGRFAAAERTLAFVLERSPGDPTAEELRALAWDGGGRTEPAIAALARLVRSPGSRLEAAVNLGWLLLRASRPGEAVEPLRGVLDARPNMTRARFDLGQALAALGRDGEAVEEYRRTLETDPTHGPAYLRLGHALLRLGRRDEALRYWRHGRRAAADPGPIERALAAETGRGAP